MFSDIIHFNVMGKLPKIDNFTVMSSFKDCCAKDSI